MFEKVSLPQEDLDTTESIEQIRVASKVRADIEYLAQDQNSETKTALLALDDEHLLLLDQELFNGTSESYTILRFGNDIDHAGAAALIREYGMHSVTPSERDTRRSIVENLKKIIA